MFTVNKFIVNNKMSINNLILSVSNLLVVPTLLLYNNSLPLLSKHNSTVIVSFFVATASTLMHLSEVKHGMPGIYFFNQYANLFLNIDRTIAITSFIFMIFNYINNGPTVYFLFALGFGAMVVSENPSMFVSKQNIIGFHVWFHFIWHATFYYLFYRLVTSNIYAS